MTLPDTLSIIAIAVGCITTICGVVLGAFVAYIAEEYRYSRKNRLGNIKLALDWAHHGKNYSLRKLDLKGAILKNVDLGNDELNNGADLSYTNLRDVDFNGASLRNANLSYSDLSGANLHRADLTNADLSNAKGTNSNFTGAILEKTNFTYANFVNSTFFGANIINTLFIRASMLQSNFRNANFDGANLYQSNFNGSVLSEEQLSNCDTIEGMKR